MKPPTPSIPPPVNPSSPASRTQPSILTALALLAMALPASAQHLDILPYTQLGRIHTGFVDLDNPQPQLNPRRHYPVYLDHQSFFQTDPGFSTISPSLIPGVQLLPNTPLFFSLPSVQNTRRNLAWWDTTQPGPPAFGPPPAGVRWYMRRTPNRLAIADGSNTTANGFDITTTDAQGTLHRHLGLGLCGPNGMSGSNPIISPPPPNGIYLVACQLTQTGLHDAAPFYFIISLAFQLDANGDPLTDPLTGVALHDHALLQAAESWVLRTLIWPDRDNSGWIDMADLDTIHTLLTQASADPTLDFDANNTVQPLQDFTALLTQSLNTAPGDLNLDHAIDLADLALLLPHLGRANASYSQADLDLDTQTGPADLSTLLKRLNHNP